MVDKKFSGNSNYQLEVTPSRSGNSITLAVKVRKLSGFGYWVADGQDYSVVIDGTTYSGTWTYDFRSSTLETVTTRTKSGLSAGSKSWSVTVEMSSGIGSASLSGSVTVPPDAPAAPTIGTPSRTSDTSHTVNWTRNATTSAPYESQQVQRRTFNGEWSGWSTIATISTGYTTSGAMSRTDSGTIANRVYQYQVRATNSAGSATSSSTSAVYTTPGTPSSLTAAKTSSGGVKVTVVQTVPHVTYSTTLQYSTDGGTSWTALTSLAAGVLTYTWSSPPSGSSVMFRARTVNTTTGVGAGLTSGWRTSNSVPLSTPPAAPSLLDPNGTAFNGDAAHTFTWQFNTLDTSPQSAYEIRHRPVGGSWTMTGKLTSETSAHTFAASTFANGGSYEWEVRTWGVSATFGAWSPTASFNASTPPTASIFSPASVLEAARVTVEWTYFDEESTAQSGWEASLLRDDVLLETNTGSSTATAVTFDAILEDDTDYQVTVRVRDGAGLWSDVDTAAFTTDFPVPPAPSITLTWDAELGAVVVAITNPTTGGVADPVSNDIYRSIDGETWDLAVTGAALDTETADPTAPVGVPVMYKAVAWSDLPSSSESAPATIVTDDTCGYWSAGDGWGSVVQMEYGNGGAPRVDFGQGLHEKTLHYFAGRTLPVETVGISRDRAGSVSFMSTTREQLATIRAMAYLPAPHMVRTPDGETFVGSVSEVRDSRVAAGLDYYDISFTITETSL